MKFHCPNCNAKYRISEEKFASHPNAKLRCKQCSTVFSVRQALEAEPPDADPESVGVASIAPSALDPGARASSTGLVADSAGAAGGEPAAASAVASSGQLPPAAKQPDAVAPPRPAPGGARALGQRPLPAAAGAAREAGGPTPAGAGQRPPRPPAPSSVATSSSAQRSETQSAATEGAGRAPSPSSPPRPGAGLLRTGVKPLVPKPAGLPRPTPLAKGDAPVPPSARLGAPRPGVGTGEPTPELNALAPQPETRAPSVPPGQAQLGEPQSDPASLPSLESAGVTAPSMDLQVTAVAALGQGGVGNTPSGAVPGDAPSLDAPSLDAPSLEALGTASMPDGAEFGHALEAGTAPESAPPTLDSDSPLEGWYLECEGTPLGPLDAASLRERTLGGALLYDTLVWREGTDDWKEAVNYPVLSALIQELRGISPPSDQASEPPGSGSSLLPGKAPLEGVPTALVVSGSRAPAHPGVTAGAPASASLPPAAPAPQFERIAAGPAPSSATFEPDRGSMMPTLNEARGGFSGMTLVAGIGLGLAVGFGAGFLLGGRQSDASVAAENSAAAASASAVNNAFAAAPPPPPPSAAEEAPAPAASAAAPSEKRSGSRRESGSSNRGSESAREETPPASEGGGLLAGLGSAPGTDGPQASDGAGGGNGGGGGESGLDANAIQSTVRRNQPGVRQNCWQRALTNAVGGSANARVTVKLKIAPDGSVTSATHGGDPDGFPGLAGCIVTRVKGWTFPKASAPTTAEVPFVFAAQ